MVIDKELNVEAYLSYEDNRYPTLVLRSDNFSVGYDLNLDTGELSRICICNAYESSECCCGAWNNEID